ncbi:hypothetical protein [Pseudomonas sp. 22 E 5]|nr:hypothetical protein [Pseudomonas sp. 22 E 5]
MFGFFLKVAVKVVDVGGALAVEADFLLDQAVGVVVEPVGFADFVFDFGEQQPSVVVAVVDLAAIGVEAAADQVQAVGVFVAGDVAEFVAFGSDFAIGVVAVFAGCTARQHDANQPANAVPLIPGQPALFILAGNLAAQIVVAIALGAAIGQLLFNELAAFIPYQPMTAVIGIPNPRQLPVFVVAVVRHLTIGIGPTRQVALVVTLVLPDRFTTPHNPYEAVVMLVGRRFIISRKQRHQASGIVVLIRRHRPERILLDRQSTLVIVGFEVLSAVRVDTLHQPRPVVMHIHFLTAIGVMHDHAAVLAPGIPRIHLRKTGPVPDTAGRLAGAFPFPEETRPTGQAPLQNDVLLVVPINLAFADGVGRANQSAHVVIGVGNNVLFRHPFVRLIPLGPLNLVIHRHNAAQFITQKQRAPDAVIQPCNTPQHIPRNPQAVVIRIADRDQHPVAKVIKP